MQQRVLPAGVVLKEQPADGNCMWHSLSAGLALLKDANILAPEIRAKVATHMRKHEATDAKEWDGELPNRQVSDDFSAYLTAIEQDKTWCSVLELRAAARVFDVRLIIFTIQEELEPFSIHNHPKRRVVAMRFNGSHYDLLAPVDKKYPAALLEIKGKPEEVPRRYRGGGQCGGGQQEDAAVVWTRSSARGSRASVWSSGALLLLAGPRASSVGPGPRLGVEMASRTHPRRGLRRWLPLGPRVAAQLALVAALACARSVVRRTATTLALRRPGTLPLLLWRGWRQLVGPSTWRTRA